MRINDSQPSSSDSQVKADDRDKSRSGQDKDTSSFSRVLAKKREGKEDDAQSKSGKESDGDTGAIPTGLLGAQALLDQSFQPTAVQSKTSVPVPPELQQLVREISSVVNTDGNQQVNIELNSNVLKGLHIRIERQKDGAIAVQFQSSSADVSRLLSKNIDALSQGLADRGVNVADIRVSGGREATGPQTFKSRSNFGGNYPGGRQGGKR
jgi:Flagellar hook-length control protein FliK